MLRKALPIETAAEVMSVTTEFLHEQIARGKLKGYTRKNRLYFIEADLKSVEGEVRDIWSFSDNPLLNDAYKDFQANTEESKAEEECSDEYWDETCACDY